MKKPLVALWLASVGGTLAGLPYAFELQSDVIASAPVSVPVLVLISLLQTAALLAVAVWLGAKAARSIGLRIFDFDAPVRFNAILRRGVPAGAGVAVAIYALDRFFSVLFTPSLSIDAAHVTVWKTLLASFYGGIVEEVLLRLFLMSVVAWGISRVFRLQNPTSNGALMWSAIVIASVVFGLGHLPATASLAVITPAVVARAIVLNGVGGLVFGWLYWKRGLGSSIVAHFTADIVLLTLLPALF